MSALGQKPTFAPQKAMSALLPKADIDHVKFDVRFGPEADSCSAAIMIVIRSTRRRGRAARVALRDPRDRACARQPQSRCAEMTAAVQDERQLRPGMSNASTICRASRSALGCRVTANHSSRRRPWPTIRKANKHSKLIVGTRQKSIAAMASRPG
jgi:hypothetical protein